MERAVRCTSSARELEGYQLVQPDGRTFGHGGVDIPGDHDVGPDAFRAQLAGKGAREAWSGWEKRG